MTWALVLFSLHHASTGPSYEWRRSVQDTFESLEVCEAVAIDFNSRTPFGHDNPPYMACEASE